MSVPNTSHSSPSAPRSGSPLRVRSIQYHYPSTLGSFG
jgi:hypothetical protein